MKKKIANWGNYPVIESDEQVFSTSQEGLNYCKNSSGFIARGNGRCYGDASLAATTISTLRFDKILSFDKVRGIFECQSGLTLDQILNVIVPTGWFLPVTPGTKFITVGGAVASDVHGKNHHVDGAFSNHVLELEVGNSHGAAYICSPTNNSELFWATCGGMGLTGLITRIVFRLKKIETSFIAQKQLKAENLEVLLNLFEEYKHYTYSVAWIDCLSKGKNFGKGILILGEHAETAQLKKGRTKLPLKLPRSRKFNFPVYLPSFFLNRFTVRLFNLLYYAKNIRREMNSIVSYEPFFYPLDAILNWNRGYGRKGFVQYQFVLPLESKQGLIDILKKINNYGSGSFLAVLKVFGEQDDLISFPTKGYTLALDFPVRKKLFEFLDELDKTVLQYGGRIYLSKDARMSADIFWKSYPNVRTFVEIVKKYNPDQSIRSHQSDRLKIT